jgi:hypothetical protein
LLSVSYQPSPSALRRLHMPRTPLPILVYQSALPHQLRYRGARWTVCLVPSSLRLTVTAHIYTKGLLRGISDTSYLSYAGSDLYGLEECDAAWLRGVCGGGNSGRARSMAIRVSKARKRNCENTVCSVSAHLATSFIPSPTSIRGSLACVDFFPKPSQDNCLISSNPCNIRISSLLSVPS